MSDVNFNRTLRAFAYSPRAVTSNSVVTIVLDTSPNTGALLELDNGVTLQGVKMMDSSVEVTSNAQYKEFALLVRAQTGDTGTVAHLHSSATAAQKIRVVGHAADLAVTADSLVLLLYSTGEGQWLAYDLQRDDSGDVEATITTAIAEHEAAENPHSQYTTEAEAAAAAPVQSVNGDTGVVVLGAADVGADASGTAAAAVSTHESAGNPHTQYTRTLRYSGTTSGSGTFSATFSPSLSSTPNVQAQIIGGTPNQVALVTSRSSTGFTVTAYTRSSINLLGSEVLLSTTSTTNGLTVDVLVTRND